MLGLVAALLTSCAALQKGADPAPGSPTASGIPLRRAKVISEATPFYKLGPAQAAGPDLSLKKGTHLTLLKRGFGYSRVQLEDGQSGTVGTEDIAPLTQAELAAEANANKPAPSRHHHIANLPIPATLDEPGLPHAEPTPDSGPTPAFRF